MKKISFRDAAYEQVLRALERRGEAPPAGVEEMVRTIIADVARWGDRALADYTLRFDRVDLFRQGFEIPRADLKKALASLPPADRALLTEAAENIRVFHSRQREKTWTFKGKGGVLLGQKVTPLARVGLYVPGGTASYPSSVLMNAVPAKVAGVGEVVMAVPTPRGETNTYVLAAAAVAGVDRVFRIGGAQAVAALAYGTETIPRVDKVVGPGNIYVATAKKLVFGLVDIDMVAGPSEILILADGAADPSLAAADLLSQAEHDALAWPLMVTNSKKLMEETAAEAARQLNHLPRREIAALSLRERGHLILVKNLAEAVKAANRIAPEHLELLVAEPEKLLPLIVNAGAIFLGPWTPEALGDYLAGPNHVLPTGGTARFSSPLGVYDFLKKSSIIGCGRASFLRQAEKVARFARLEGLEAHARAAEARLPRRKK